MKILVFAFACDPSAGSEPNYGYHLVAGLAHAGHQVVCITQSNGRAGIEAELAANPRPGLSFEYTDLQGRWKKLYKNQLGLYAFYLTWQWRAAKRARQLDAAQDFDIVHHITWGSFQMGTGAAYVGKPFVFGPCGGGQFAFPMFKEYFGTGWKTEVQRKYVSDFLVAFNPMLRKTVHAKQGLMVPANTETAALAKRMGARHIVPYADPALPLSFWKEQMPPRQRTEGQLNLIWAGRLGPRKGLKFTLKALALVDKNVPWRLTILGDGPQAAELPVWLQELGIEDRVHWKGSVPWLQMQEEYARADAFILTTLRDSAGVQFLEAMAYGLPIFTLNMHGATIVVPEAAGYKIPITDPDTIAKNLAVAVADHYHHPERWAAMAQAGRDNAFAYLWPQKIAFFEKMYADHLAAVRRS